MKRIFVFLMAAIMVGSLAFSAQAVTVLDPNNGEMHLFQIVANPAFGTLTGYNSSQAFADAYPVVATLSVPSGFVTGNITAFAKFASFTQDPGIYASDAPNGALFNSGLNPTDYPLTGNGIFNNLSSGFQATPPMGFADKINGGQYIIYTQAALNQGGLPNGLIFQISPTHFIVAFEDGAGAGSLGDKDYNDLVFNVTTSAVPIPPSALLVSSGLLGLVLLRRFRKS